MRLGPGAGEDANLDRTATTVDGEPSPRRTGSSSADRSAAPLQIRDRARYETHGEHARGGAGRVLRARDKDLGRDVAVKELLHDSAASELRFFREALITARLEHPSIVPVHEAGRWPDGTPFYTMKFVHGRPLRALIDECRSMEDRLALIPHVIAVADAIAYAHDRRIIHRDLKPSNVIVGEFGETIVIDWGLAKDLTAQVTDPVDEGPYRTPPRDGLTLAGSVLGTPAYMAPEQRVGDADERSDVYALGGMLFHVVCGRAPHGHAVTDGATPTIPRAVPRDLAAIVRRAMSSSPARRYDSAQRFADDLRRFGQRRPISARRYSFLDRAVLGFARHRAISMTLVAALAAISTILAIDTQRVGAQRARAVASEQQARRALDDLKLQHAELLLASDPSDALDVLRDYRGDDAAAAGRIRAEAIGRGVARLRATPHTDTIVWLKALPDGSVATLSTDGTIGKTALDGDRQIVARGASPTNTNSYSASRGTLAYACTPNDVCLADVINGRALPTPDVFRDASPDAIAFSPTGDELSIVSHRGDVTIWDISKLDRPTLRTRAASDGAFAVRYVDDQRIALATPSGIVLRSRGSEYGREQVAALNAWDVAGDHHRLVLGTRTGDAWVIDADTAATLATTSLCRGLVNDLRFIPSSDSIAFACQDGTVGTWETSRPATTMLAHLDGGADVLAVSTDGTFVVAGANDGRVVAVDRATGLLRTYAGHKGRVTALSAPSPDAPFITSADVHGAMRVWSLPPRVARVAATTPSRLVELVFASDSSTVIATSAQPTLLTYSPRDGAKEIGPHERSNLFIVPTIDRTRFATFGVGGDVEVWSATGPTRHDVIETRHGAVSQVMFAADSSALVTAGQDGRLFWWMNPAHSKLLATLGQPITSFVLLARQRALVVEVDDGSLWRAGLDGGLTPLRAGGHVTMLQASRDGDWVAAGYATGDVVLFDTHTWSGSVVLRGSSAVRHIALSHDARMIAIATADGVVHVGQRGGEQWSAITPWSSLELRAKYVAFSPQGDVLLAAGAEGSLWFYQPSDKHLFFVPTGAATLVSAAVSPDGHAAATADSAGRLIWIDLNAVRDGLVGAAFPNASEE